ncbi:hypothetical protein [Streptomyces sp. NPDC055990]|uniref:hypothetical protein n=1 Tax=Streptomyces sp. NPDC055990 TaxID=3345672 RepID=UPI0035E28048
MPDQAPRVQLAEALNLRRGIDAGKVADAVIAAGWRPPARVIEDPVQLDMLPAGSIVAVGEGVATTRFNDGWYVTGEYWDLRSDSHELIERCGPVAVLHTPGNREALS